MLRINARGVVITSIVALALVLLFVAQWKHEEISAWRGPHADVSSPNTNHQDTKLDEVTEFKDDAVPSAAPVVPDFSAGNATLGVRPLTATCHSANTDNDHSSKQSSHSPKEPNGASTAYTPQQKSPASL